MHALTRQKGWTHTELGPPDQWPQSLRVLVNTIYANPVPTLVLWGKEKVQFYNKACWPLLGDKHIQALGQSAPKYWPEHWETMEAAVRQVWQTGKPVEEKPRRFSVTDNGQTNQAYYSVSYSAIFNDDGHIGGVLLTFIDRTEEVLGEQLQQVSTELMERGRERMLAKITAGASLEEIFRDLIKVIEEQAPEMIGSVLLLDESGQQLRHIAAPSLPDSYNRSISRVKVGPEIGSCGAAAYLGKQVVVTNIEEDAKWEAYRELAREHNIAACWSKPIFSVDDKVLGTFALYYRKPRGPNRYERGLIDVATYLARVAIDRKQTQEVLSESEERYRSLAEDVIDTSQVGTFVLNSDFQVVWVSQAIEEYLGICREDIIGEDKRTFVNKHIKKVFEAPERFAEKVLATYDDNTYTEHFEAHVLPGKQRKERWLEHWSQPIHSGLYKGGRIEHYTDITERKQVEDELRRSEEYHRMFVDAVPDIGFVADAEGASQYLNQRWYEFTGLTEEKSLGDGWMSAVHPKDRARVEKTWTQVVMEEGSLDYEIEFRLRRDDGTYRWYLVRAVPLRKSDGKVIKYFGTATDIDEYKRTRETLRERTHTLETINEVGNTLAAELELETIVQAVTDAGTEICGAEFGAFFYNIINEEGEEFMLYTLSGAPMEEFSDYPHPRNTDIFGPTFYGEGVIRLDDVTQDPRYGNNPPYYGMPEDHLPVKSYLAVPVISRSKEVIGGLFFGHSEPGIFTQQHEDIITSIAAQAAVAIDNSRLYEAARENEERFRAVTENAIDVTATVNSDAEIQYISASVEEILGYSVDQMRGKDLLDYVHPEDLHAARNELTQLVFEPDKTASFTLRFKRKEGEVCYLSLKARNLTDRPGVEGLLLNIRDVTEVKRYEAKLIKAKETAEEMTRLKSNLLANMSHEIRTPLTGILGLTSSLSRKVSEEQREEVQLIEQSGQRLMDTLNSVMTLAQLEGQELEMRPELLNVTERVEAIAASLSHLANEKGLSLEVESDSKAGKAYLDPALLNRILNNLVGNAIKFTEEGGIRLEVETTSKQVIVRIHDTGVGISEEFMPHLFDEFKQESTGLARSHEGSGLGLVITKRLVEVTGGSIDVASEKGKGSTFTVSFSRAAQDKISQSENVEQEASTQEINSSKESTATSILLVEDNDIIRRVIVDDLSKRYGYDVEAFPEAEPALERAKEKNFDMVLMDISLPKMDGVNALKELRTSTWYAEHPIIAITGHALPGDRERFLKEGFSEYLAKPFTAEELTETMRSLS